MSKISAKTLPEGWYWLERCNAFPSEAQVNDTADLYSPHDCHAGEIRASHYSVNPGFAADTWDEDGTGGENSAHDTFKGAKTFVEAAILRQGFHMECDLNCSDHGCVEEAAELAAELVSDLGEDGISWYDSQRRIKKVVKAMLGPKAYREWLEENVVSE